MNRFATRFAQAARAGLLAAGLTAGLASGALAQAEPAAADRPDYAAIEGDPALWVVEDEDSTLYLFGSFHILPPELGWRSEEVAAAFSEADTIWFEADVFSEDAAAQMQALVPQLGVNEPGVTLSSLIDDEAEADLAAFAEMLGAQPDVLMANIDQFRPWFASLRLAIAGIQALGYDPNSGVERVLHADAVEAGKEFGYFETIEQQLRFFADMPLEAQVAEFELSIADMVDNPDQIEDLAVAWATGDMETIDRIMNESLRDTGSGLYERLIVERNEDWIPQIEAILDGEGVDFVAVGVGHMPGDAGVIALMRAEGHEVTRR
ncbi:TraB/GumN family protein [Marinicauda salina]|nr:TraB/GumN family protein [Marinicauda salina]